MEKNRRQNYPELRPNESGSVKGGNLWPFFDLKKLISEIMYGEDLYFENFLKD